MKELKNKYLALFINDIEFAKAYLSVNYPFSNDFIQDNWALIHKGDAHYSVYLVDTGSIYNPKFGLSFNDNIKWNSRLKKKYKIGFDNYYNGYIEGIGIAHVEFDERDSLDDLIPLSKKKEFEFRNNVAIDYWASEIGPTINFENDKDFDGPVTIDSEDLFKEHNFLEFKEFLRIFENKKLKVLVNESIWKNTLSKYMDDYFCKLIFDKL